jgi:hypothetical protein
MSLSASGRAEDGRVYLKVKNEFEVSLTVYGEDPKLGTEAEQVKKYPWVVLSIDLFISSSGTRIMPPGSLCM